MVQVFCVFSKYRRTAVLVHRLIWWTTLTRTIRTDQMTFKFFLIFLIFTHKPKILSVKQASVITRRNRLSLTVGLDCEGVFFFFFLTSCVLCVFRLGRWWRIKEAKNGLYIIPLKRRRKESTAEQQHNNTLWGLYFSFVLDAFFFVIVVM